jgi:hypothetical protein
MIDSNTNASIPPRIRNPATNSFMAGDVFRRMCYNKVGEVVGMGGLCSLLWGRNEVPG